ncbi:MFS transporter [Streptomyces sp. NPDC055107]
MSILSKLLDIRPLRSSPAFRWFWLGSTLSTFGSQLTVVAVYYQVWEATGSGIAVGAVGLAQAIPMILGGLVGGTLADSMDRRTLVLLTSCGQAFAAALLVAQAVAELGWLWPVLAAVAIQAACAGVGAPARRTFVARLLDSDQVAAGVALNHFSFQVAMLVGPVVGGFVVATAGVQGCYLLDMVTFGAVLVGAWQLPRLAPPESSERPGLRSMWAGWQFIAKHRVLTGAFLSEAFSTVTAMPIALFPMINAERFGGNPENLGLFFSAFAIGGVLAGALSGAVVRSERAGAIMLLASVTWGAALTGFGLSPHLWLVLGFLAIAGAADTISVISRGSIVQVATPDAYRGRVSSVEHVLGAAGPEVGNFRAGVVASATSTSISAISGGVSCVVLLVALAIMNPRVRQFRIPVSKDPST